MLSVKSRTGIFLFLLLIVTVFVYFRVINFGFIINWDDNINVTNNNWIQDWSWSGIKAIFNPSSPIGEARLTLFTYFLDYHFWKLDPMAYHIENILLHLINIFLAFILIQRCSGSARIGFIAAVIFALHPMKVESVAWVSGRKDMLFSMFFLVALLAYSRYLREGKGILMILLVMVLSFLSLQSKIQAWAIPAVLFLFDYYYKRRISLLMIAEKVIIVLLFRFTDFSWPQILLFVICFLLVYYFKSLYDKFSPIFFKSDRTSKWPYFVKWGVVTFSAVFILYVIILAISMSFNFDISGFANRLSVFLFLALFISGYQEKGLKGKKVPAPGENMNSQPFVKWSTIFIYILFLLVVISFVTGSFITELGNLQGFGFTDRIFMASYSLLFYIVKYIVPVNQSAVFSYPDSDAQFLPSIYYWSGALVLLLFIAFSIVWLKMRNYRRHLIFGSFFFLLNISLVCHLIPIAGRVIVAERYTYLAYLGLAFLTAIAVDRLLSGASKMRKRTINIFLTGVLVVFAITAYNRTAAWKDGIVLFSDVIDKQPDNTLALNNRGTLYLNLGNYNAAKNDFNTALSLDSSFSLAYYNRALVNSALRDFNGARQDCSLAIKYDYSFADAWYLRGFALNKLGCYVGSIANLTLAIKFHNNWDLAYYNRGNAKKNISDFNGALFDFDTTIYINANFAEAYNARGVTRYFLNDYQKSVEDYSAALLLKPSDAEYLYNRALSYLKLEQTDLACIDLSLAETYGRKDAFSLKDKYCR